jgi:hypothetical protein
MSGLHAPLAPSAAKRWIQCPGSIAASRDAPPERPSRYAEEGTRAHTFFAECLLSGAMVAEVVGDSAMLLPLQRAVDAAREIIGLRPVLIEQALPPLPDMLDVWGTADICLFDQWHRLEGIIDLKFGVGLPVEAHDIQLAIYAVLAAHRFGVSPNGVTAWIIQPRCLHPAGPVRSYTYTAEALTRLTYELDLAATATTLPDAPRYAGAWCRFCPARPVCEELRRTPEALPPIGPSGPPLIGMEPW